MKRTRHPLLRPGYLWLLAAACAGAGLVWVRVGTPENPALTMASRPSMAATKEPRPAVRSPRESVMAWSEAAAETVALDGHPAITITGRYSARREEAFQQLISGMQHDNATDLYQLLHSGGSIPTDREWQAFMEKWGRLDGPGAAVHIGGFADSGARIPGLLRGWASVDPATAKAWLEARLATADEREGWHVAAQRELVLGWLHTDSGGAADWLNDHQDSAVYPEIASAFAKEVVTMDPANALEWAGSVEGPWRRWAVETVGRKWLEEDPAAASAALRAAGYGDELIEGFTEDLAEGFDLLDPTGAPGGELPGISFSDE